MKKTTVQTSSAKRLLSPQEFAQFVKIGRLVRIPESEVERLIEAAQRRQQEVENG